MARVKKPADYIGELCLAENGEQRMLGWRLRTQYERWIRTLSLKDFLEFNETIMANKTKIGLPQFFGKFRAYAFEEYVYRLLKDRICINEPLKIFWGGKCLVWREIGKNYALEFDISIGVDETRFVNPVMVFDAKIELDSSRLKTALTSFAILKRWKPEVKCIIAYVKRELAKSLLTLAEGWADGIFQFSMENNETAALLGYVADCLVCRKG